jgi:hypothetical protein
MTSVTAGSIESWSRNGWPRNQVALTLRAWRVNDTHRPKTVAAYLASTICWRRSAIRSMRNTRNFGLGRRGARSGCFLGRRGQPSISTAAAAAEQSRSRKEIAWVYSFEE